ncbi:MAG: TolC family protein [Gammaproteobacteria bacterium]
MKLRIIAFSWLTFCLPAWAVEPLTLDEVLSSSLEHFPRIQRAVEEKLAREGDLQKAEGAFDLALEQDSLLWASGYYEGRSVESRLVKPLPQSNAKLTAGYRIANDDFPIYQQERVTNDAGEINFGVVFSLWRDRDIDPRRFELLRARLAITEADLDLALARVVTQRNAAHAYWRWVAAGRRVEIYRQLAALADARMAGLERRVAAGDVAAIQVVENRQNLLRRQSLLTTAERDFETTAIDLSLYLRDSAGRPLQPSPTRAPAALQPLAPLPAHDRAFIAAVLERRPEFARIDAGLDRERGRLRLAENELKPRIDLGLKAGQDLGGGARSREDFDTLVDVTISIPLETRRGRGMAAEARSRLRQLELDRQLLQDQVAIEIDKLETTIDAAREFVGLTSAEVEQAALMEQAERDRFSAGASDFFLVNLREERSADARIRHIDAHLGYTTSVVDYQAATFDTTALGL